MRSRIRNAYVDDDDDVDRVLQRVRYLRRAHWIVINDYLYYYFIKFTQSFIMHVNTGATGAQKQNESTCSSNKPHSRNVYTEVVVDSDRITSAQCNKKKLHLKCGSDQVRVSFRIIKLYMIICVHTLMTTNTMHDERLDEVQRNAAALHFQPIFVHFGFAFVPNVESVCFCIRNERIY